VTVTESVGVKVQAPVPLHHRPDQPSNDVLWLVGLLEFRVMLVPGARATEQTV